MSESRTWGRIHDLPQVEFVISPESGEIDTNVFDEVMTMLFQKETDRLNTISKPDKIITMKFDGPKQFPELFADPIALTLYLLWRPGHVTGDGFHKACLRVAENIRKSDGIRTSVNLIRCFPMMSHEFPSGDVEPFCVEYIDYFTGKKRVGYEVVTDSPPASSMSPERREWMEHGPQFIPKDQAAAIACIQAERRYQNMKWPGYHHSPGEWLLILEKLISDARREWMSRGDAGAMDEIRQVTATGLAAMEQCGAVQRRPLS